MKRSLVVTICWLVVLASFGRSQTSTPPAQSDHTQMHAQHMEHTQSMCKQMMAGHVAEMKAASQTLATNLAQMKSTLPLISDLNERSRWQSNIAMWQALADHFSHMAQHAEHMEAMGMGCGMMMGHGTDNSHNKPVTKPQ
jgi:TolA-binding protein